MLVGMSEKITKISVVGLENAGKTSLVKTLFRTYDIGESISPTKNVERTNFSLWGSEGGIWDYGGQEMYRKSYLEKPMRYFSEIQFLFFVVDIQDTPRYSKALDYFEEVYRHASSLTKNLSVVILFHKFDPEIDIEKFSQHTDNLGKEVRHIVESNELLLFKTSIYDPISILEAFSKPILGSSPIYNANSVLFANFAMDHDVEYITLIVDDLFELGSFKIQNVDQDFIKATMQFYQEFARLDKEDNQEFELENYQFVIYKGSYNDYKYSLNLCYPSDTDGSVPKETDIKALMDKVENNFKEYQPEFY